MADKISATVQKAKPTNTNVSVGRNKTVINSKAPTAPIDNNMMNFTFSKKGDNFNVSVTGNEKVVVSVAILCSISVIAIVLIVVLLKH